MTVPLPERRPAPAGPPRRQSRLLASALLALLAACAAHREVPPPAAAPPSSTARVLRVGLSGEYPPFSLLRDGQASGFGPELMETYARARGLTVAWVRFRWPELSADLAAHRFDVAADGITVRPERSLIGRYTVPVASNGAVLLLRRPAWAPATTTPADPLTLLKTLDRPEFRLAVNRGGHLERVARAHFTRAQIIAIPDNAQVREALARGQADAALTNTVEGPHWAEGLSGIETVGPFTRDVVALFVDAANPALAADLDTWLLAQEENGTLGQLRSHGLGPAANTPAARPVEALLDATAERLSLMPWVADIKRRTNQPIEVPAQEARVLEAARADVRKAAAAAGLPAPSDAAITAFFQAQIDAAKEIQLRTPPPAAYAPTHSLDGELRPALTRISARMSALVPRVPAGLDPTTVRQIAREHLADAGLSAETVQRLADALVALGAPRPIPAPAAP